MEPEWKVHTPQLLKEVLDNPTTQILKIPLTILAGLLFAVAKRASELNDPQLNALMCRLTLYEISDPYSSEFDKEKTEKIISQG